MVSLIFPFMKQTGFALVLGIALLSTYACASGPVVALNRLERPSCESGGPVEWVGPAEHDQRVRLSNWCASVGPAVISGPGVVPDVDLSQNGLTVVSWNVHEGGGDVERLLDHIRDSSRTRPDAAPAVVMLVQEAMRGGGSVPSTFPAAVTPPGRIAPRRARLADVVDVARQMGLWVAYVPSMRNGRGSGADDNEDRGSAILSTLPLSEAVAIELPWVHQRRVAVMATVLSRLGSAPWHARMVSVHLDNRPNRSLQAASLAGFLRAYSAGSVPLVVGGDLNTWFGARETTVGYLDAVVPRVEECGDRPTFRFGLHLDHMLTTLAPDVRRGCDILDDSFGSDHRPTVLRVLGPPSRSG
jgi:hypothetical protein